MVPLSIDELWRFERLGGLAIAPDGRRAVVTLTRPSMARNTSDTQLWLLATDGRHPPRPLTQVGSANSRPAWSPRGDRIAFVARREQQGAKDAVAQLYLISPEGGEAWRAAELLPPLESFRWLPDGSGLVFAAWVWPGLRGAAAQRRRWQAFQERKETGHATSEAQHAYWDHRHPMDRVVHLLHLDLASGRVRDLFEGSHWELPRDELAPEPFDVSPDGRRVVFTFDPMPQKRADHGRALAEIELRGRRVRTLVQADGWDFDGPRYGPDGRHVAAMAAHLGHQHTAMMKPALVERDSGRWQALGADWDHEMGGPPRWSADASALYFSAERRGRNALWRLRLQERRFEVVEPGGWVQGFDLGGAADAETLVTLQDGHSHPARVFARPADGSAAPVRLERFNDARLAKLKLGRVEEVQITGAQGDALQLWLTYPADFDHRRRHPVLQVIHGGPYAAAGDSFSYRWNAHLLASRGHVVAQLNYHGSSGFGLQFKHSIMGRLAALESEDIEAATNWVLQQRWADPRRVFAAGGSYGGFLVAWMNGHVPPGRYRAYVCHAGVYDRIATFAADSWPQRPLDLGAWYFRGMADMGRVLAQSPHAFAGAMHTPTLVTHGALDYRVPDSNGLAYYNTLKARGVGARLLWFPDENHWVLKPRNSQQWFDEVFAWLARHDGR
jgi:dipeptidyl aminopeptidase/acylaminoacyl peptidase